MKRVLLVGAATLVAFVPSALGARTYTYPPFQPVSVAFVDAMHGVLAEDDWVCQKPHGCQGRLLVTSDGGGHWHLAYLGARGFELFPVRGSNAIYAFSGNAMLISLDAGVHWKRLHWSPAVVSFVSRSHGWRLGPARTLAHPPELLETRDGGRSWAPVATGWVRLAPQMLHDYTFGAGSTGGAAIPRRTCGGDADAPPYHGDSCVRRRVFES